MSKSLLYEDLIGNACILESDIRNNITLQNELGINTWSTHWSVEIAHPEQSDQLAIIKVNVTVNNNLFIKELIIYKSQTKKRYSFSIEWGSVPHPIIPIIYTWLKKTDSAYKRIIQRTQTIKHELIESAMKSTDGI